MGESIFDVLKKRKQTLDGILDEMDKSTRPPGGEKSWGQMTPAEKQQKLDAEKKKLGIAAPRY